MRMTTGDAIYYNLMAKLANTLDDSYVLVDHFSEPSWVCITNHVTNRSITIQREMFHVNINYLDAAGNVCNHTVDDCILIELLNFFTGKEPNIK